MRETGILRIRASVAAAEFQRHIVDGVRVGVTEQRGDPLAQTLVGGELESKVFREAVGKIVVHVALQGRYAIKWAARLCRGRTGDRLVRIPGVLQVPAQISDSDKLQDHLPGNDLLLDSSVELLSVGRAEVRSDRIAYPVGRGGNDNRLQRRKALAHGWTYGDVSGLGLEG